MYNILITKRAKKDLNDLDKDTFSKIKNKITSLMENPRGIGSIKLTNTEIYRVRVSKYRIIYEIDDKLQQVVISRVKHRKDAYRE